MSGIDFAFKKYDILLGAKEWEGCICEMSTGKKENCIKGEGNFCLVSEILRLICFINFYPTFPKAQSNSC